MRSILKQIFLNSVSLVRTNTLVESALKIKNNELVVGAKTYPLTKNYYCVGFGKAVLGMACQVEKLLHKNLVQGIISVPVGSSKVFKLKGEMRLSSDSKFCIYEGAVNNLPDEKALKAAEKILQLITELDEDDILLVLISGGGSALLPLPIPPVTLEEKVETIKLLASHGATITELNCVRQNLSQLKGGKLAALAHPAQVISLILSDIINDPIDFIASGPTAVPQCSTLEAINILKKYSVYDIIPKSVITTLSESFNKPITDLSFVQNVIVGNNAIALDGILRLARSYYDVAHILSNSVQGLVDEVAKFYMELVKLLCEQFLGRITEGEYKVAFNQLIKKFGVVLYRDRSVVHQCAAFRKSENKTSLCLLMGGETTVQVKGSGVGGRNQELALNFGLKLTELVAANDWMSKFNIWFLSAGTDGIDGPTDAAGAITNVFQMKEAAEQNLDPLKFLENNDSNSFYSKLNNGQDLIKCGLTGTNVMDIHVLVIEYDEFITCAWKEYGVNWKMAEKILSHRIVR